LRPTSLTRRSLKTPAPLDFSTDLSSPKAARVFSLLSNTRGLGNLRIRLRFPRPPYGR